MSHISFATQPQSIATLWAVLICHWCAQCSYHSVELPLNATTHKFTAWHGHHSTAVNQRTHFHLTFAWLLQSVFLTVNLQLHQHTHIYLEAYTRTTINLSSLPSRTKWYKNVLVHYAEMQANCIRQKFNDNSNIESIVSIQNGKIA